MHTRADRVRGLPDSAQHGMCASATRSRYEAIGATHPHLAFASHATCTHLCPRVHLQRGTDQRCVPAHRTCTCVRRHVRAPVRVLRRMCIGAETCEQLPPAGTACGSTRRRSTQRRGSTRTSARGTPCRSPRCSRYAPLSAGGRTAAGALGAARHLCATAPPMRARICVCTHVYVLAAAGVDVCMHSRAKELRDT